MSSIMSNNFDICGKVSEEVLSYFIKMINEFGQTSKFLICFETLYKSCKLNSTNLTNIQKKIVKIIFNEENYGKINVFFYLFNNFKILII